MQLSIDNLAARIGKSWAPVYLLSGDEPLQQQEAADLIRKQARSSGFAQREVYTVGADLNWEQLLGSVSNLSLFAEQRLLELRVPDGKMGKEAAAGLCRYLEDPPTDVVLVVLSAKLDRTAKNSRWYKAIDQAGVVVTIWPINAQQIRPWLSSRAKKLGLKLSSVSLELLIERTEGNLLALSQELDKLSLCFGDAPLDEEQVARAVVDSARFSIYDLADAALSGDAARSLRILQGLREEGDEPVLILWSLVRELRSLAQISAALSSGQAQGAVLQRFGVWKQRVPLVQSALRRNLNWPGLLQDAARLDRQIKGIGVGDPWLGFESLLLKFSGLSALVEA